MHRIVKKLIKYKNRIIENNSDLFVAISNAEKFIENYFITITKSSDEYVVKRKSKSRIIIAFVKQFSLILFILRLSLSLCALSDQQFIRDLMCDFTHILGENRLLIALSMININFGMFCIIQVVIYQDLNNTMNIFRVIYLIKHRKTIQSLKARNYRKFWILYQSFRHL